MVKNVLCAAALALLIAPSVAFGAGFAKQSLFLSKSAVTEGDTVLIHAVVNNDTAAKFAGELVFSDAEGKIGSVPVTLGAKEADVASVSWKPSAGQHTVVAELHQGSEVVEKESASFTIAAKPKPMTAPTSTAAAAVESSSNIQNGISSVSPAVGGITAPFFKLVDGGRSAVADVLDTQLANTKKHLGTAPASPGEVLGSDEVKQAGSNPMGTVWYILQTLYFYVLTILRFVVGSAGIFYPVIAVLFLYILWRAIRRMRRSSN